MKVPYELFIGLRYLKAKKKQRSISVNTLISIGGVTLGVMATIIVLSVMTGAQDYLRERILGIKSHVVVMEYGGNLKNYKVVMEKVKSRSHVISAAPFVLGQGMLTSETKAVGVLIRGIDPEMEKGVTELTKYMKEGRIEPLSEEGLIIGKELSRNLSAFPGDKLRLLSPFGTLTPMGLAPKIKELKVVGIFDSGMYEFDSNLAYVSLREAQKFFNFGGSVTGIDVKIDNIYKAKIVADDIAEFLGMPYFARDWMQMNRNLFSALKLEKIAMFIILILIIFVAAFNIISTLIMIVMEKNREIAILKSMGATNKAIMNVFMVQGIIIGITGTVLGIMSGYLVCYFLKTYQFISLPSDIYYGLTHLPVKMNVFDFLVVSASALVITLIATIYPSWQAARLDPIEPLRYE
ncbi:MAG: lipoprotein-releasing ABC transporter permease subunit [Nitrospirota bacterium]